MLMDFNGIPLAVTDFQLLVGAKNFANIVELDIGSTLVIDITAGSDNLQCLIKLTRANFLTQVGGHRRGLEGTRASGGELF